MLLVYIYGDVVVIKLRARPGYEYFEIHEFLERARNGQNVPNIEMS